MSAGRWPSAAALAALAAAAATFTVYRRAQASGAAVPPAVPAAFALVMLAYLTWHAGRTHGWRTGPAFLATACLGGYGAEALGTATGFPFGRYHYLPAAGPQLPGGVPVSIVLFWFLMIYLVERTASLLLARRPGCRPAGWWTQAAAGAALAAGWDLVADPLAVAHGAWSWPAGGAWFGVPLTNTLGWLAVAGLILAAGAAFGTGRAGPPRDRVGLVPVAGFFLALANHTLGVARSPTPGAAWAGAVLLVLSAAGVRRGLARTRGGR